MVKNITPLQQGARTPGALLLSAKTAESVPRQTLLQQLAELTGEAGLWRKADSIFSHIETAEEEIEAAIRRKPEKTALLWPMFLVLRPVSGLQMEEYASWVLRAHYRELLERVAMSSKPRLPRSLLRPPTWAEVTVLFSEYSFITPLRAGAVAAYGEAMRRMAEVLGADAPQTLLSVISEVTRVAREQWPGEMDELLGMIRRKSLPRQIPKPEMPPMQWLERVFPPEAISQVLLANQQWLDAHPSSRRVASTTSGQENEDSPGLALRQAAFGFFAQAERGAQ